METLNYNVKGTSINSPFKQTLTMKIKTFACFMFFLGIFLSFFQSHSSLCSFEKNKNLLNKNS